MPNVGKSTLINHMRGHCRGRRSADSAKKVAKVGPKPGVTRGLESFRIAEPPHPLYMVDTPGVMVPRIDSAAVGLRLALTAAVPDSAVGEELLVEYLFALLQDRKLLAACVRELGMHPPSNCSTATAAATADATAASAGATTKAVSSSSSINSANKQWLRELTPEDILVGAERACGGSGESQSLLRTARGISILMIYSVTAVYYCCANYRADYYLFTCSLGKHDQQRREMAARYLLRLFRVGKLGRVTLDAIDQPYPHEHMPYHTALKACCSAIEEQQLQYMRAALANSCLHEVQQHNYHQHQQLIERCLEFHSDLIYPCDHISILHSAVLASLMTLLFACRSGCSQLTQEHFKRQQWLADAVAADR
eukprot:6233-Heterococcus_DN1.PRE.2